MRMPKLIQSQKRRMQRYRWRETSIWLHSVIMRMRATMMKMSASHRNLCSLRLSMMRKPWGAGLPTYFPRLARSLISTSSQRHSIAMRSSGRKSEVTSICGRSCRRITISKRPIKPLKRHSHNKTRHSQLQGMKMMTGAIAVPLRQAVLLQGEMLWRTCIKQ